MLKAWRAWKALTEEQRQLIAQGQVTLSRPIDETIALLKPIADMDKLLGTGGCATLGCTTFAAIFLGIAGNSAIIAAGLPSWLTYVWLALWAVVFLFTLVMYLKTRNIDVSDNLRNAVMPMLYVLRDDIDPQRPVELTLDLRAPMAKEKLLRTEKPRERMTETFYNDAWIAADATLIDGSRLRWSVVDTIRHRSVTKKGRSGKWKTKTKDSKKCSVDVELTVRNKSYEVEGGEAGEKKTSLSASKTMKLASANAVDPQVVLEVITDVFRRVQPAK
jgi:hypothetical protein